MFKEAMIMTALAAVLVWVTVTTSVYESEQKIDTSVVAEFDRELTSSDFGKVEDFLKNREDMEPILSPKRKRVERDGRIHTVVEVYLDVAEGKDTRDFETSLFSVEGMRDLKVAPFQPRGWFDIARDFIRPT